MEDPPLKKPNEEESNEGFESIVEDILQLILSTLPAKSFAYAACVCPQWRRVCDRILSRPKFVSALSLNPNFEIAMDEVIDKILAEPIRPQFALAFIGKDFSAQNTQNHVLRRLGRGVTVVVCESPGIIGADALTDEFTEVIWDNRSFLNEFSTRIDTGLVLMVGSVPGLRVLAIPLVICNYLDPRISCLDKFVNHIKDFTASVSGCSSPLGIIMFAGCDLDMKPVLDKLDYAMSKDTTIVGDDGSKSIRYSNGDAMDKDPKFEFGGGRGSVALVFAKEKESSYGEIQFSIGLSTGVIPKGPVYECASVSEMRENDVRQYYITAFTARREGLVEEISGMQLVDDAINLLQDGHLPLYLGFVRQRKCSIGSEEVKWISSLAFHKIYRVDEGDDGLLYVVGDGIEVGDKFQFYQPDSGFASSSRNSVIEKFKALKNTDSNGEVVESVNCGTDVFGGLVFCCRQRDDESYDDSSVLTEIFPGLQVGGKFCAGEIGRSTVVIRGARINNFQHVGSAVYLLMLYSPKKP